MTVRLVRALIQLDLVIDDGTALTPIEIQPITVPGADWPLDLDTVLKKVAEELGVDEPAEPTSTVAGTNGSERPAPHPTRST